MKPSIIGFIKRAGKPGDVKYRNQLYVFLICLGLSIFIWLLIKMSQSYVTTVSYRFSFSNIPAGKILKAETKRINLMVKGKGADLFSLKYLTIKPVLDIDLGNTRFRSDDKSGKSYILVQWIQQKITNQIKTDFQVTDILPDTLFFSLERIIYRKVAVVPDLDIELRKQFMLYDSITVDPSKVIVSGPEALIDTLSVIKTKRREIRNLDETTELSVQLRKSFESKDVTYSVHEVQITVPVEKFTELSLEVPVEVMADGRNTRIKTFPEKVNITFLVALKDYPRISENQFRVEAAYEPGMKQKLDLNLTQQPSFIRSVKIEPASVDFIIMKK